MKGSQVGKLALALAIFAAAGFIAFKRFKTSPEDAKAEETYWLCTQSGCEREFTVPRRDIARLQNDNPDAHPACPTCQKATTIRAVPCPKCNKYLKPVGHGQLPNVCPQCKQPTGGS